MNLIILKTWKPDLCSCSLGKVYLQNNGYLQSAKKKKKNEKEGKSEYQNRFFPFALRCTFSFPCLDICWNLWKLFEI